MNVLIVNGSPKGEYSVTLQTCKYLQIKFPQVNFGVIHAGQHIRKYERDFSDAAEKLSNADLILFSYPVYTFIAPCQLHRFIELMKESGIDFSNKIATQISTSKHFYDVTAHKYIQQNCNDMGMKYVKGLSADMDDLLSEKGRNQATGFFKLVLWSAENNCFETPYAKVEEITPVKATVPETAERTLKKEVAIVTDMQEGDAQLDSMIKRFTAVMPAVCKIVNIREYPMKGGCLGCFNCAATGKCVYKDGFDDFLRNEIQSCDAMVYAFTIKDHSMGSRFKMYDDRQFCNGHRTVTMGMPVGYIINGNYSKEENLKMIVEGRSEVGGNFLAGVATSESDTDAQIDRLAKVLAFSLENGHVQPANFLGVGGMRIFRDLIYQMQGLMREDHKFFKKHGQYDFPQKKKGTILAMYLVGSLANNKKIKAKIGVNMMNEGMLMPYKKVLTDAQKNK